MQKLVGCFLILLETTGAGWMYGTELRNSLEELSHFRRIIEQIKGELLYAGLPLSEIFYLEKRQ